MNKRFIVLRFIIVLLLIGVSIPCWAQSQYFTGDGGKGMSMGIQVPEGKGLNAALSYIPSMVQGCLVYNIRKYSAITPLDPVALDKVITETLNGKYEDNLDIVRLGHVAHVSSWMTGKIIETPYGYTLQFNVTDTTPNAKTLASYNGNCTASQLIDQSAIQLASIELLTQMGVQLTAVAKNELSTTNTQQSIKAQSFLANSRTAERQGDSDIAVYFNAVLAAKFDPALPEATNRSAILAANISSARTGDNLREDVRWRNEWKTRLEETEKYVKNYNDYYKKYYTDYCNDFYKKYTDNWNNFIQTLPELPYTLFYYVDAHNYGGIDYDNNTTNYTGITAILRASQKWIETVNTAIQTQDAAVAEVRRTVEAEQAAVQSAIREVVKTVNDGLEATGQRTKWKLQPLNVGITAVAFDNSFVEKRGQKQGNPTFSITVELVNSQNSKVIGRSTFQIGGRYSITNKGLTISDNNEQKSINFTNVNINDIPPSDDQLAIRITSVNGTPAETAARNGVLQLQVLSKNEFILDKFVRIQGGTFTMGSPANETRPWYNEGPQHQVTVSSFYMGKYEVTQKEWQEVMGTNPSNWKGDNLPVERVNWYDVVEYCNKRSEKEGLTPAYIINKNKKDPNNKNIYDKIKWTVTLNKNANGYRLPTEAEWEYACRAGTNSAYNTGNTISDNTGWYSENSDKKTHPVGQKSANAWGLYDMHGNVWEWCWDWYGDYSGKAQTDPQGASSGSYRVLRGGSWYNSAGFARSASRYCYYPGNHATATSASGWCAPEFCG